MFAKSELARKVYCLLRASFQEDGDHAQYRQQGRSKQSYAGASLASRLLVGHGIKTFGLPIQSA